jgi:hypothetical protein
MTFNSIGVGRRGDDLETETAHSHANQGQSWREVVLQSKAIHKEASSGYDDTRPD